MTDKIPPMKISRQRQRRRLRTKVVRKIEEVPPDAFDKIFPRVPERYHFFKTLDGSGFEQFSFYYILVYEHKELVGIAPCFAADYPLKKIFPRIFSFKAVVCGIPMGQGQIGMPGFSPAVLAAIEERMEALARKLKAAFIILKDFDSSYNGLLAPLLRKGFLKIDGLPMTRLALDFKDFEDYLETLSSATRHDLKRKLKKTSAVKIESNVTSALDETTLEEAYALYLQTVENRDMGFETTPKRFFHLVSKNMPGETKFFCWHVNGKLAAFVFCLNFEGVLLDYYMGADYTLTHEYHLYFFKFKEVFEWCLKNGIKTYEMGATGYEPKRRLKFAFVPVYLYVKARSRLMRPILKVLRPLLKFENFDPELKKWKKSAVS